jgi:DNA polymerase I-like protein with 3'-5' exonuclease and polymerase domains
MPQDKVPFTIWTPGMEIPEVSKVGIDTETERWVEGESYKIMPVVCMQVYGDGGKLSHFVWHEHIPQYLAEFERVNPQAHYVAHNTPFDYLVLGPDPSLTRALCTNRLHDTYILDSLHAIYTTGVVNKARKLKEMAKRHLGITMSKDEDIRCTFTRDMDREQAGPWLEYAMYDAYVTYELSEFYDMEKFYIEPVFVRSFVALDDISRRGFLVDPTKRTELEEHFTRNLEEYSEILADFGWFPGTAGNTSVLQSILEGVEVDMGITLPRTEKTGKIKTGEEVLAQLPNRHPFANAYSKRAHDSKMVSTYLSEGSIGNDGRTHTRFNMASTTRTTSSKPNMQNLPRKGGLRNMFIPTPGYILASVDYAQLELCSLAESCYRRFGHSKLLEVINSGTDVHKYMATFNTGKPIDEISKEDRNLAKVSNFGYPGGLSPTSFVDYAKGYGLDVTVEQAEQAYESWITAFPEMEQHLQPMDDLYSDFSGRFWTKTWLGFERRNATMPQICNTEFQSTGAYGAAVMLWNSYCKGFRMVNFIHDEIIPEIPMEEAMRSVLQNVRILAEPALMTRWYKEAEPVLDDNNILKVLADPSQDSEEDGYVSLQYVIDAWRAGIPAHEIVIQK